MKILTKIWKKLLNESGIPVLHTINELTKNFSPIWATEKTLQTRLIIRYPSDNFDVISFRIE